MKIIKEKGIIIKTSVWDFLASIKKCLPNGEGGEIDRIVSKSNELGKTTIGKSRIFIRLSLNENSLKHFLIALFWNKKLTASFYFPFAFFCSDDFFLEFMEIFEIFSDIKFVLSIFNDQLNSFSYYLNPSSFPSSSSSLGSSYPSPIPSSFPGIDNSNLPSFPSAAPPPSILPPAPFTL